MIGAIVSSQTTECQEYDGYIFEISILPVFGGRIPIRLNRQFSFKKHDCLISNIFWIFIIRTDTQSGMKIKGGR